MYKAQSDSIIKTEIVHVATEFNKNKYKDLDAIKLHLQSCRHITHQYELDDESLHQESSDIFGIQHNKICCGYGTEIRVPMCSKDHQAVYVVVQKDIDQKSKGSHIKWIKKIQ